MWVEKRNEITNLLISQTFAEGLEVQQAFFEANNPFQPVSRPSKAEGTQGSSPNLAVRQAVRAFWASQGVNRRDGPTIKDMALEVVYIRLYLLRLVELRSL
jgi:hypothetical protein